MRIKIYFKNYYKTLLIGSVLFFTTNLVTAQQSFEDHVKSSWEVGISGGFSNYKGDITPNIRLFNSSYSFGVTVKYNPDYFSGIRLIVNSFSIYGNDKHIKKPFNQFRNSSFNANFIEIGGLYDYNFIPFTHPKQLINWSPYLVGGFSMLIINTKYNGIENVNSPNAALCIPFGGGTRIQLDPQWILNFEILARKTFTDLIDLPSQTFDDGKQMSISTNNDWIYTFQVGISYTFYSVICPDPVKKM